MQTDAVRVVLLAGGYGGAKMAHGFCLLGRPVELTVVGNTADDLELHGLHISPDLDTVMYTLAGLANPDTGWGVRDETWSAAAMLERYGAETWFGLGDRDLATHVRRTELLAAGLRLTEVTGELSRALGVSTRLLPVTDDRVRTQVRLADGWYGFQDYFVRRHHADDVLELRFEGIADARPTAEVLEAIGSAQLIVIAPSNPFVSIGPLLAVAGVTEAMRASAAQLVAISPIVAGAALRGPAEQMLRNLGHEPSAAGVARLYAERYPGLLDVFVLDRADEGLAPAVAAAGLSPRLGSSVMKVEGDRARLAAEVLELAGLPAW